MAAQTGVIAAGDPLTAEAAALILKDGGNAFDAAIAAAFASFVAEASLTSLGGGGFLMASKAGRACRLFDFFTHTPLQRGQHTAGEINPIIIDFQGSQQEFFIGNGTIASPGNLAGLFHVQKELGRMPFAAVLEPAQILASQGYEVSKYQANCIELVGQIWTQSEEGRDIYAPGDELLKYGELFRMTLFSDFLEFIGREGIREFYEGEIAQTIERHLIHSGYLTQTDLTSYEVIERDPVRTFYDVNEIFLNPSPSTGGTLIDVTLRLLMESGQMPSAGSVSHLQQVANALYATDILREKSIDRQIVEDPGKTPEIDPEKWYEVVNQSQQNFRSPGNTTHISVVDKERNIASVTTTVGQGSGFIIPGTGIMMNNMLGESDLMPQGIGSWIPDRRVTSMMCPTIIRSSNGTEYALGTGGANRIRSAIAQVIYNLLHLDMSLGEAIHFSRIHWTDNELEIEGGSFDDVRKEIIMPSTCHSKNWNDRNLYFGGVHAVGIRQDGFMYGAADGRRNGCVIEV